MCESFISVCIIKCIFVLLIHWNLFSQKITVRAFLTILLMETCCLSYVKELNLWSIIFNCSKNRSSLTAKRKPLFWTVEEENALKVKFHQISYVYRTDLIIDITL